MAASLSAAVAGVVMCLDTRGKEATCLPARLRAKPDRFVAAVVASPESDGLSGVLRLGFGVTARENLILRRAGGEVDNDHLCDEARCR